MVLDLHLERFKKLAARMYREWVDSDCVTLAASVSFYAAVSFIPFLLVLVSAVGLFFKLYDSGQDAQRRILDLLAEVFSPRMSEGVGLILESVQASSQIGGPIATIGLFYAGSRMFAHIDRAFEHIWEVRGRGRKRSNQGKSVKKRVKGSVEHWILVRLRSFVVMGGFGAIVVLILFGSTTLYSLESILESWFPRADALWGTTSHLVSILASALVFSLLYHYLSKAPVKWRLCLFTGLVLAILWDAGRIVIANILIGDKYTAFGIVGSFLGILLWIFYNVRTLLLGAVFVRVRSKELEET